jgi:H+/gluconate symporter-like permease
MGLADLVGLLGILIGLGLLIWLAFRGWSVLLLAPIAAVVAAAFSREPVLAHWTQTFMRIGISRAVLPDFPARRVVRQTDGG